MSAEGANPEERVTRSASGRHRLAWGGAFAFLGLVASFRGTSVAATDDAVAKLLGDAVGGSVAAADYIWEPTHGGLTDAFAGRLVTFVASREGGPRDVWRARVRVARSGKVLGVRSVYRVTESPLSDEGDLIGERDRIAFRSSQGGTTLGLGVLLLAGEDPPPDASALERALISVERYAATGSTRGLGRVDVVFAEGARELRFDVDARGLVFAPGEAVPSLVPLPPAPRGRALHQPNFAAADRSPPVLRGSLLYAALAERIGALRIAESLRARVLSKAPAPDLGASPSLGGA